MELPGPFGLTAWLLLVVLVVVATQFMEIVTVLDAFRGLGALLQRSPR